VKAASYSGQERDPASAFDRTADCASLEKSAFVIIAGRATRHNSSLFSEVYVVSSVYAASCVILSAYVEKQMIVVEVVVVVVVERTD